MRGTRPVGHVTDLIGALDGWAQARERKYLDTRPLRRAMAYLEEYRETLAEERREGRRAQDLDFYFCSLCRIVIAHEEASREDPRCPICGSYTRLRHIERRC